MWYIKKEEKCQRTWRKMLSPRREARDLILSSVFLDEKNEGQRTKPNIKTTHQHAAILTVNHYFHNINKFLEESQTQMDLCKDLLWERITALCGWDDTFLNVGMSFALFCSFKIFVQKVDTFILLKCYGWQGNTHKPSKSTALLSSPALLRQRCRCVLESLELERREMVFSLESESEWSRKKYQEGQIALQKVPYPFLSTHPSVREYSWAADSSHFPTEGWKHLEFPAWFYVVTTSSGSIYIMSRQRTFELLFKQLVNNLQCIKKSETFTTLKLYWESGVFVWPQLCFYKVIYSFIFGCAAFSSLRVGFL